MTEARKGYTYHNPYQKFIPFFF